MFIIMKERQCGLLMCDNKADLGHTGKQQQALEKNSSYLEKFICGFVFARVFIDEENV